MINIVKDNVVTRKINLTHTNNLIFFDLDDTLYNRTLQVADDLTGLEDITLFDGAVKLLSNSNFIKVLVTNGDNKLQMKKLDLLSIKDRFDHIFITKNNEEKKECFKKVMSLYPRYNNILVIGNRIDSEIRYGNILGLKTILLKHGKYGDLKAKDNFENPDYVYEDFNSIIKKVEEIFKCKQ